MYDVFDYSSLKTLSKVWHEWREGGVGQSRTLKHSRNAKQAMDDIVCIY